MTREMQNVRDLIVKMTLEGASKDELKRAIDYSKTVIDAHKESKWLVALDTLPIMERVGL